VKTLFKAGRQLKKIRFIIPLFLACAAGSVWGGFYSFQYYGLNPGDGGVLAPLPARVAWGAGLCLLGIGLAVVTFLYARCYVAQIGFEEQTGMLHITTVRLFGTNTLQIPPSSVIGRRYYEGYMAATDETPEIHTPFWKIRLDGRKLPLIIDLQGELIEPELLRELFLPARRV
jgi:hypothetical protein